MRALRIQAKDGFVLLLEDKTCIPIKLDSKEEVTKQLAMSMSVFNSKFEEGELIINGDKMHACTYVSASALLICIYSPDRLNTHL